MKRKILLAGLLLAVLQPFAVSGELVPADVSEFYVTPDQAATLRWNAAETPTTGQLAFTVFDVNAEKVSGGVATIDANDNKTVIAEVTLPQGYWEIAFDTTGERFGIVSQPAAVAPFDEFFAIDAALSWLVQGDDLREGIIKSAKRSGIGMMRERFRLAGVAPVEGQYDWQTRNRYDALRQTYKKHGVEVLEMSHDAPAWMGKRKSYPKNLAQYADAWHAITEQWQDSWGAVEVWNEPDIFFGGNLPADQYLPLVKAYAYRANQRGGKTPIVGGSLALPNLEWLENARANNLLDLIDVLSFHTYEHAPTMENLIEFYRNYVAADKVHENMPLWLTECGRPWKKGPSRPPVGEDLESATDIVMKGVESKCCGIDRYFPFVLPYYEENDHNFGMLDRQGTPLRSFAGYAQMIHALAHKEYVGDLKSDALQITGAENQPPILRARVFRNSTGGPNIVVLYTCSATPTTFRTTFAVRKAETVTGESCEPSEIRSGLIYLYADALPDEMIETETNAMRLLSYAKKTHVPHRRETRLSPVVPVYQYDEDQMKPNSKGYRLDPNLQESRVSFQLFNLSNAPQSGSIGLSNGVTGRKSFHLPPRQSREVLMDDAVLPVEVMDVFPYDYQVQDAAGACVDLRFLSSPTMEGQRKQYPDAVKVPLNKERWTPGIGADGTLEIETVGDTGVKMSARFGEGDKWCYPRTALPEGMKFRETGGFFAKIRYTGEGTFPRIFLFEHPSGAGFLSDDASMTPWFKDGEGAWYVISVPFSTFMYNGSTPPPIDGKRDFDRFKEFSFGFNTTAETATLEIGEVWIYE